MSSNISTRFPGNFQLEIQVTCHVYPSESPDLVKKAIGSILNGIFLEYKFGDRILGKSNNYQVLNSIYNQVRDRSVISVLRRFLLTHLDNDTTWFYVNKQAATKGMVVLVENKSESPLGPICITLKSNNINKIIDWLSPD